MRGVSQDLGSNPRQNYHWRSPAFFFSWFIFDVYIPILFLFLCAMNLMLKYRSFSVLVRQEHTHPTDCVYKG